MVVPHHSWVQMMNPEATGKGNTKRRQTVQRSHGGAKTGDFGEDMSLALLLLVADSETYGKAIKFSTGIFELFSLLALLLEHYSQ
jgi:hypothetical protein